MGGSTAMTVLSSDFTILVQKQNNNMQLQDIKNMTWLCYNGIIALYWFQLEWRYLYESYLYKQNWEYHQINFNKTYKTHCRPQAFNGL